MFNLNEITRQTFSLSDNWKSWQFWISFFLGVASVIFSIMAFAEAKKAKKAAIRARTSLSIRNIENELGIEISLLNDIQNNISYSEMRKICLDLTSKMARIREIIVKLKLVDNDDIQKMNQVISNLNFSLSQVKPDFEGAETRFQIFNGMATVIADTSQLLSTIIGKIQAKNLMEGSDDK